MLRVAIIRVRDDKVERLRAWMAELGERVDEVRETFAQEGTRHEQVRLLPTSDGPVLIYVMEVEDPDQRGARSRSRRCRSTTSTAR